MKKYAIALMMLSVGTFAFAGSEQQDPTARLQAAGTGHERDHGCAR